MELKQVIKELKELDKEWQKEKENDGNLKQIISDVGFNSQEEEAYDHVCIAEDFANYLPNYLSAKLRLLKAIKDTEEEIKDAKDDDKIKQLNNKKQLLNAARIYAYTLFENTWFGYLIAYANKSEITFELDGKKINPKSYNNHLPSFSSAILHFGTCRDLFFPLLKIIVYLCENGDVSDLTRRFKERAFYRVFHDENINIEKYNEEDSRYKEEKRGFLNSVLAKRYLILDSDLEKYLKGKSMSMILQEKNIENNDRLELNNGLKKLSKIKNKRDKLYAKIKDKNSCIFSNDLKSLLDANNSAREKYLEEARNFYKLNQFRNIFAHQLRMLWWKNRELWGFYSKHYDNIKLGNRDELWPVIERYI